MAEGRKGLWLRGAALALVVSFPLATAAALAPPVDEKASIAWDAALAEIDAQDVAAAVEFLTSDRCAGRDTPQPGLDEACRFVVEQLRSFGLEGAAGDGGFLWHYPLRARVCGDDVSLVWASDRGDGEGRLGEDFVPARRSPDGSVEGEVVFAGYGIVERKWRWDSYKRVRARGKVVAVLAGEPRRDDPKESFFDGIEMTEAASLGRKAEAAAQAGARGLIVVCADEEEAGVWLRSQLPALPARGRGAGRRLALPTIIVGPGVGHALLGRDPAQLRDEIDRRRRSRGFAVEATRVRFEVAIEERQVDAPQVAALYRGTDQELSDRYVVVGAHLDHVGVDDRGRVYRGADDNAGGAAALLEVAEAFGRAKPPVRRSVVFLFFTGEEHGLLGSSAWCSDPPLAIDRTDAMINMDIVARGRRRAIEATPPPGGSFLSRLRAKAVRLSRCGLKVGEDGKQFFQRSDQFPFHQAGVPVVFLNEGRTNEDYHRWTDTADKILPDKVARVARLAFAWACLAADADPKEVRGK